MTKNENTDLRLLLVTFFLLLTVMLIITLYPFNFCPPNGVKWLSNEPGLYFNGYGIAYTDRDISTYETNAVSIELWLKERFGSKNWGPREIFSFYDGSASPSLLVGQWGGRIFTYSRFEKNDDDKWYRLFRTKHRFPRGSPHLVTITLGRDEKAIYIDGELNDRKMTEIHETANVEFSGRLLLGNSPAGKKGWWGEIKGLAIYNRVLLPEEIISHSNEVFQKGMNGLVGTPGCLALFPFNEGKGNTAEGILGESRHFYIPASRTSRVGTMFNLPHKDMRFGSLPLADLLMNIILFFPFGLLFSALTLKKYTVGYFVTFLVVTFAGFLLSFAIEFLQLFLPTRSPGITDLLSNTAGSGIGVVVFYSLKLNRRVQIFV